MIRSLATLGAAELFVLFKPTDFVSGDCFHFARLPNGDGLLLVADASGHSIPAAHVGMLLQPVIRPVIDAGETSPARILQVLNRAVMAAGNDSGAFIAAACLHVPRAGRSITLARAGVPLPLVRRASNQSVEPVFSVGLVLGADPDAVFEDTTLELNSGDGLLLFTDGVEPLCSRHAAPGAPPPPPCSALCATSHAAQPACQRDQIFGDRGVLPAMREVAARHAALLAAGVELDDLTVVGLSVGCESRPRTPLPAVESAR